MQIGFLRWLLIVLAVLGSASVYLSGIISLPVNIILYSIFTVIFIFSILIKQDDDVEPDEIPIPTNLALSSSDKSALDSWNVPKNIDEAYSTMRKQSGELAKFKDFYNEERQKNNTIREIAHNISIQKDMGLLYQTVLERIRIEFKCQSAFMMSIEKGVLKLRHSDGVITDMTLKVLEMSGLLDSLVKEGQSVRIGADAIFEHMIGSHDKVKNLLCVPLKTQNDETPFGLIGIANYLLEGDFTSDMENFLTLIAIEVAISVRNVGYINELERNYEDTLLALAQALEGRDKYTHGHVDRVKELSERLAIEMNLPDSEVKKIRRAATLHDVGKISTPDNILHKQSRLSDEEWLEMRKHAEMSAKILEPIQSLPRDIISMVLYHHERWDGKGYPTGIKGDQIPLGAQIIAVADAFDAMTSDRPYRKGMDYITAIEKLKAESIGTQFSPAIANTFINMMEKRIARKEAKKISNSDTTQSRHKISQIDLPLKK